MVSSLLSRTAAIVTGLTMAGVIHCNVSLVSSYAADLAVIEQIEKDTMEHICSNDTWLQACFQKSGSCQDLVKPILEKCFKEVLTFAPAQLELQTALMYSVNAMMCFNRESSATFGPKPKTAACIEAARHLE